MHYLAKYYNYDLNGNLILNEDEWSVESLQLFCIKD